MKLSALELVFYLKTAKIVLDPQKLFFLSATARNTKTLQAVDLLVAFQVLSSDLRLCSSTELQKREEARAYNNFDNDIKTFKNFAPNKPRLTLY